MGSSPSAPTPPDPVATANAATNTNIKTATNQQQLNMVDQVTPYGNLTYNQTGDWGNPTTTTTPGSFGHPSTTTTAPATPHYTATTSLSPEQQNLYNLGTQTQSNLGNIGVEQSGKVRDLLNTPFDFNNSINNQQSDIAAKLLNPQWDARSNQLQQQLANQGVSQGSEAYTNAMRDFGMQRDNSYNSALLASRAQASTEALANRNQPLNEISALMSGSQVAQPNFVNTPNTNVAPVDYAGIVNNNYQGQMAQYNAQLKQQGGLYGALGGMAGTLGGFALGGPAGAALGGAMGGWGAKAGKS